ncbi:UNVERIFIED_CONTAM: hypothetical protein FKN15_008966 [Acipenser sinensis]
MPSFEKGVEQWEVCSRAAGKALFSFTHKPEQIRGGWISNGDSVTQPQTSVPVKEDENTTIHCQYEATSVSPYLFWYIQECNKAPQHMLGLYSSTESRFKEHKFFTVRRNSWPLNPTSLRNRVVECATNPRQPLGMTQGDAVHQLPSIHLTENEKRILFCQYETSGSPDLFWYIQEHNKAPELLLNEYLNDNPRFKERFSASHDKRLSYGDEVRPWKNLQTSEETQETKIYCSYSLSNNAYTEYLFWYQQKPGRNPRYILHHYKASGGSKELRSEESDRRFIGHLNTSTKMTYLSISNTQLSDSALYYCALGTTVMLIKVNPLTKTSVETLMMEDLPTGGASVTSIRVLVAGEMTSHHVETPDDSIRENTQGQSVNQNASSVTVKEEENATLPCYYKDAAAKDVNLFWYIQTGSRTPHPIYSDLLGDSNFPSKLQNRLSASHDKTGKTFNLIISSVELSDSSVYFCALQPTARESAPSAIQ